MARKSASGSTAKSIVRRDVANLVEMLRRRAHDSDGKLAVGFLDADERLAQQIHFAGLDRRARAIGAWIAARCHRGARVLLLFPTGVGYIEAFFGCVFAGAIAVPLFPPHAKSFKAARLNNVLADSAAELVLAPAAELDNARAWLAQAGRDLPVHALEEIDDAQAESWQDPQPAADDIVFLQYTSGSTNAPKGVMVSHANLLHNFRLMAGRFALDEHSVVVSWLPIFHDLGMVGNNLLAVYLGASQYLMVAQEFVKKPGAWLRAISTYRGVLAMAPNFAYRLCSRRVDAAEKAALDLSSWRIAVNAGEPVIPDMCDDFIADFAGCGFRAQALVPAYGMAETSLLVSATDGVTHYAAPRFGAEAMRNRRAVVVDAATAGRRISACGALMDEMTVRIVDPDTRRTCAEGEVGEIWTSGDSVTLGYWRKPEATEAAFRARTADTDEGPLLRTGDMGFLFDGQLYCCGRLKNMIIVRGQNYSPQDIEVVVESCDPLLRPDFGTAFAVDIGDEERLVVVQECDLADDVPIDIDGLARRVAEAVAEAFELQLFGLVLVRRGTLSKTTSGKPTREKTRTELLEKRLDVAAQWLHPRLAAHLQADAAAVAAASPVAPAAPRRSRVDIGEWLRETVAGLLEVEPARVDPALPFKALGLDSSGSVQLAGLLEKWLGGPVAANVTYDYPSIVALAAHLSGEDATAAAPLPAAPSGDAVAIVGLACRFPGATDAHAFWRNLADGVDAIGAVDPARWDGDAFGAQRPDGVRVSARLGGFVDHVDQFDADFFGISRQEAAVMDPQQRLLLEVAWEALESAGITLDALAGSATGVFVGISNNDYARLETLDAAPSPYDGTGNAFSIAANRLSYLWDLRGPSMAIDTACSSSLVAVHQACRSLLDGESTLAFAGGVNLLLAPDLTVTFCQAGMMSPQGRCRSFDDGADGYVRSEGCGIVLLKRLADAQRDGDRVFAVIRGSAVNQDGRSNGLTAPNGPAQERVIGDALTRAGLAPEAIDYVEAHGSGTPLGDPIEAGALAKVFAQRERPLLVGSVKSNIGHLEAAAGIAGLIKVVLALGEETLPASLHFAVPNRHIAWSHSTLQVCDRPYRWPRGEATRRAGVASFGFGGTNAHVIVEEAPAAMPAIRAREANVLVLSARSADALRDLAGAYAGLLERNADAATLCAAAAQGRSRFRHRLALAGENAALLAERLAAVAGGAEAPLGALGIAAGLPRVGFVYSGQGGLQAGVAAALYRDIPLFRERLDECARIAAGLGCAQLLDVLVGADTASLRRAAVAQPALFALQYALGEVWHAAGVTPQAVAGHSIGEYAAACRAGALSAEDALRLLCERGRLMDALGSDGGMLAVDVGAAALLSHLAAHPQVVIAALNGPRQSVCAGSRDALAALARQLHEAGLRCTELDVTHAFHSPLMRPMLAGFAAHAQTFTFAQPRIAFASALHGQLLADTQRLDADYWTRHIEAPVDFAAALTAFAATGVSHVVEIGPRPSLTALGQQILPAGALQWAQQPGETRSAQLQLLGALARLFAAGAEIDWRAIYPLRSQAAFRLPTYPFQRVRCWNRKARTSQAMSHPASPQEDVAIPALGADAAAAVDRSIAALIGASLAVAPEALDRQTSFLEMGMDSISLIGVVRNIERDFGVRIEMRQMFESLYNLDLLTRHVAGAARTTPAVATPAPVALSCGLTPPPGLAQPAPTAPAPVVPVGMAPLAPAAAAASTPTIATAVLPPAARTDWGPGIQGVLSQQLDAMARIMQSQLALLGGAAPPLQAAPAAVASATAAAPALPPAVPARRAPAQTTAPSIPMWKVAETSAAPLDERQRKHLDALIRRYCARTRLSKEYAEKHRPHLADNRVVAGFRALTKEMHYPLVGKAAQGARMWDVDGNEYIDVTMGFGVNLFGHNPPFITDAITRRLAAGVQLGPQADLAGECAQLISELTGNERSAFVSTGTEAVMIACRLARAATRRETIAIFNGAYHGQHDSTIAVTDPEDPQFQAIPGVPGVTRGAVGHTVMLSYGERSALDYIAAHADELAAVLVEPVQSRQPELQPREFLHALRALTEQHGIALIFDEMITGFRCHPGGAQAHFDVRADLVTYGKIVGGGLPIGVVSGKRRFMDVVDGGQWRYGDDSYPMTETTFVSGTHSKHPLTMAAAHATLSHLKQQGGKLQERLNARTAAFAGELNAWFAEEGVPIRIAHFSSLFRVNFAGNSNLLYYHMLEKGVFLWEGRVYMLSTAHTDADLARIVEAIKASVDELREGGFLPARKGGPAPARAIAATTAARPPQPRTATADYVPRASTSLDFSLSFFGRYEREYRADKYDLLFAGARYADANGYAALWVPERHFHPFGGFSPNPSVTAAALARETSRIALRAGSVVIPLHHPIRVAEEWALVDNLSNGRVGIAAASGWHPEDFVLAPENYRDNRAITFHNIDAIQQLWRGDALQATAGSGAPFGARIYPMPKQGALPVWVTVVKNPDTYAEAGRRGFGVLTNMMGQTIEELRSNIAVYRAARAAAGLDPEAGVVTVLVHTYITDDAAEARRVAAAPFRAYLATMAGLLDNMAKSFGKDRAFDALPAEDREYLLDVTYQRYVENTALIGSAETCAPIAEALMACGVNELACFVDFGVDADRVLAALPHLSAFKARYRRADAGTPQDAAAALVVEEDL
ncbi:MAG: hypothetical protein BGP24_06815 [Lysobacterales bacterium 69-70]|nr:aminotransferase class III-fold pyridoxal phosphate-dependent enzyme [Xanthomonadaceae bacterium]ODU35047.1 MAG: hypothetical protein ABS97_07790 [Xanthomonadaceae bacterium SCN 69-320]ODV20312.1 MAG: hypothetical protein ABT27_08515 [Xanthomonadaceae bacterium SCN 69-25]OJY95305.1 MAG: hypothetical protein BGP24_06815 [Xanthomonadales bacterium 69-70]